MDTVKVTQEEKSTGTLIVRVSTARGAIPLENAAISIRGDTPSTSGIVRSMRSDADGLSERVSLPAPDRSASSSPGGPQPFSTWNVDVSLEGYIPVSFTGVPVYSGIVSVQPAVLVPIPEGFYSKTVYSESTAPQL